MQNWEGSASGDAGEEAICDGLSIKGLIFTLLILVLAVFPPTLLSAMALKTGHPAQYRLTVMKWPRSTTQDMIPGKI